MKIGTVSPLRLLAGLLATIGPALAYAQAPDKGDTAWMLTSTALVLLMSVPALALFYGGLVRSKNMLSVLMQVFVELFADHGVVVHVRLLVRVHDRQCVLRRTTIGSS